MKKFCQIPTNHRVKVEVEVFPFSYLDEPEILVCKPCLAELKLIPLPETKPVKVFKSVYSKKYHTDQQKFNELKEKIRRFIQLKGRVTQADIATEFNMKPDRVSRALDRMKDIVGTFQGKSTGATKGPRNLYYLKVEKEINSFIDAVRERN